MVKLARPNYKYAQILAMEIRKNPRYQDQRPFNFVNLVKDLGLQLEESSGDEPMIRINKEERVLYINKIYKTKHELFIELSRELYKFLKDNPEDLMRLGVDA